MESGPRVLVVDDDQDILAVLKHAFESYGLTVQTCPRADEAEAVFAAGCFDYVITDHDMDGMSGLELTRRLRRRCPRSVIIGMSGRDLGTEFLTAGANDFLRKPFTPCTVALMIDGGDLPS